MSENNGWPGKPGVPLNPEQDGWHWGERDGGLEPRFWSSGQQLWAGVRNSWIAPKMLAALFNYAGPCLTPAEVEARVSEAQREALEEAALVAENEPEPEGEPPPKLHGRSVKNIATAAVRATKRSIAAAIRALSDAPTNMVLVPREPTSAMIHAGGYALQEHAALTLDAARIAWDAMVKAAGKGEDND
jgi:hypothetical protein